MVLDTLRQCHLFAKESKCVFGAKEISYLRHVIFGQGVAMDTTKVEVVQSWPQPKTVCGLRGFLGLVGYYRRFIANFGVITRPLTQLLKKECFTRTTTATEAFDALKKSLTTALFFSYLTLINPSSWIVTLQDPALVLFCISKMGRSPFIAEP
jgi:hypothetical protein